MNKPEFLNIAFQMDDLSTVNPRSDTTFALMVEAKARNYNIYYYQPHNLSLAGSTPVALMQKVESLSADGSNPATLGTPELTDLAAMNIIWVRQDPPFNMNYLCTTYILNILQEHYPQVLVVNDPTKIRNFPEKVFAHRLIQYMPQTLITKDRALIENFLEKQQKVIMKPLFEAKGDDVLLIEYGHPNANALISYFLHNYQEPVIVQQFLPKVSEGDKRVLIVAGVIAGVFNRVPTNGLTSNLAKGGVAQTTSLTPKEEEVAKAVADLLSKEGLFFAGVDLIDGHLTEINLTSPTGVKTLEELTGVNLCPFIWNKLEEWFNTLIRSNT